MTHVFNIREYTEIKDDRHYAEIMQDNPEHILSKYADFVALESNQKFEGRVFKTVLEDTDKVVYSFYVISSEFGDVMYRLVEVTLQNVVNEYPAHVEFNTIDVENGDITDCKNSEELKEKLEDYFKSEDTGTVFSYLDKIVKVRHYERSRNK